MTPEQAFAVAIGRWEGLYSSNPADKGNWAHGRDGSVKLVGTMRGVTADAYAAYLGVDPASLTPEALREGVTAEVAGAIGVMRYYDGTGIDRLPWGRFAAIMADWEWGSWSVSIRRTQALVRVTPDGVVGPATEAAVAAFLSAQGEAAACAALTAARKGFYAEIAAPGTPNNEFLGGWNNRADWFLPSAPPDPALGGVSWWSLW